MTDTVDRRSGALSTPLGNNFDAVRLIGALLVLVGHGFPLHGRPDVVAFNQYVQVVGLVMFFSVSGYLIPQSWARDAHLPRYLVRRALRIFPGLAVVTILTVLVIGPAMSSLSVPGYFADPAIWTYLANIALFPVYGLPGVFTDLPVAAVNVSLWSLPAEFACYLIVPLVGLLPRVARSVAYAVLAIGCGIASTLMVDAGARVVVYGTDLGQALSVWIFFMVGAVIATVPELRRRTDVALILVVGATVGTAVVGELADPIWWFVMPYAVIAVGTASTPGVRRAGRFGDLSYGLYLWAFPIQQVIIRVWSDLPLAASVAVALVTSLLAATASWHLIEKRALRWKPRTPAARAVGPDAVGALPTAPGRATRPVD